MESEHLGVLPHHIAPTARPKVASASPQSFHFSSTSPTICNERNLVQGEQRDYSHPLGRRPDAQALLRPRLLARLSSFVFISVLHIARTQVLECVA